MTSACVSASQTDSTSDERQADALPLGTVEAPEQHIVRVEANFLRLPLFALDNKHMRTMDGIRCEGTFRRAGQAYAFTYVVTRNARTLYPGPLARSAHFAILSLASDRGFPVSNPIVFSWRELCGRMGIQVSGQIVGKLREALTATKGLMIESHSALFSKAENRPLSSEEHAQVIGLYDELEFYGAQRPDGSTVEVNAVWLSRWYLDNLNALYSGPLDYGLWRSLNDRSPIASRLYEFLFFKFYGAQDLLRFNYPTLVKFIPARTERYLSDAKKQLDPAFALLTEAGILEKIVWSASRAGQPQILLYRGASLSAVHGSLPGYDVAEEDFVLAQVDNVQLPEWQIVSEFHRLWGHENYRPSKAELDAARSFLQRFGLDQLKRMLPVVTKRMQVKWPDAKTFVAASRYLEDLAKEFRRKQVAAQRMQQAQQAEGVEVNDQQDQAKRQAELRVAWGSLSEQEQQVIRSRVLSTQPANLAKFPAMLERLCLLELAKQSEFDAMSPSRGYCPIPTPRE